MSESIGNTLHVEERALEVSLSLCLCLVIAPAVSEVMMGVISRAEPAGGESGVADGLLHKLPDCSFASLLQGVYAKQFPCSGIGQLEAEAELKHLLL